MSVDARLQALGIELPPLAIPAAAYLPFVQTGSLVFISGHIAKKDGKAWVGQLGLTMTTEEGKAAARDDASAAPGLAASRPSRQPSSSPRKPSPMRLDPAGLSVPV